MVNGKESPLPPTSPSYAWGAKKKQAQDGSQVPERQRAGLLKVASSGSWPTHADSPTSASDTTICSAASEAEVKEALNVMQKFLQEAHQEASFRERFLDCIDMITVTINDRGEQFKEEIYNASLIRDALQFLLPLAFSSCSHEREMTLARMTRLIGCIPNRAIGKGMKDLKLGKLAGCFTLCCSDSCDDVALWAADGLHHVYTLVMQLKCRNLTVDSPKYQALMKEWEEEKTFWLAWFSDVSNATMVFKKLLRAEEQMDFILMAIRGMRHDNIHNTKCAVRILRTMLRSPVPDLVKATKGIQLTYKHLENIADVQARHEVFHYICLLGDAFPEETVNTLLGCSLQCDSTSAAMWRALTSSSDTARKILASLQAILLEQPANSEDPATKATLNPLAAISAIYEILRQPTQACKEAVKDIFPMLSIALLCQISYTMHYMPKEIDFYWRTCIQQKTPTPPIPFRSALRTFNALVKSACHEDQVLIMLKRRGSEFLLRPSTHQKGLCLFARAMIRNEDCGSILPYILKTLDSPEDFRHITMLTFLVELLRHQTFHSTTEDHIIRQLRKQLNATKEELRSLALDGMLQLAPHSEKIAKLEPAVPDILKRLKESNRAINVKALKVLRYLLKNLEGQAISHLAIQVANQIVPLVDDASHKVRLEAISTFSSLIDNIRNEDKESMKELAVQTLVPLLVHLHDVSPQVAQASRDALKKVDRFLKSIFQMTIGKKDSWKYSISLLRRYRKLGEHLFVEQAFFYLDNSQHCLREASLKLLEIIAIGSRSEHTLTAISTVVNLVKSNPEQNTMDLVPLVMQAMDRDDTLQRSCFGRLRKFFLR